jgi:glycosyltransferase involved in cell wall biosynthesis
MRGFRWALITGEYPPQIGGVSDHTRQVARGLAEAGDEVHVWAPSCAGATPADPGVHVQRLPGHFGWRALAALSRALDRLPRPRRVLVQYVPQAFGWKGMNVPFCLWLCLRRRERTWVMFHEVAVPLRWRQPLSHNVLGLVTRFMAALLGRRADRVLVSTTTWESLLPRGKPVTWIPIPSNVPTAVAPAVVRDARARVTTDPDAVVVGHFSSSVLAGRGLVAGVLPRLLAAHPRRIGLLVGQGSRQLAAELIQTHPGLASRLHATGTLPGNAVADHLAACDLLLQPFPDGVSTRRGTVMAGLALGLPIVTSDGSSTEPLWRAEPAVVLAPAASTADLLAATEGVLADAERRERLRIQAAALYGRCFTLERVIHTLRSSC